MNEFEKKVSVVMPEGLLADRIEVIQVNVGRYCNLSCRHCHLACSSQRTEMMSYLVMEEVARITDQSRCNLVDITGGAPELHPDFKRFIELLGEMERPLQVRTNLVALLEPESEGTVELLRDHAVALVGSLPCYTEENVDYQRGRGTFQKSIEVIRTLNALGYGETGRLKLDLVYNPRGAFLPGGQEGLQADYKRRLMEQHGIRFSNLVAIANMPIGRFGRELERTGEQQRYQDELEQSFNPQTLCGVMCRRQVCVDWDGTLYDCDFNLALGLRIDHGAPSRIAAFDPDALRRRRVVTGPHCFGCTAGAGSSCGGSLA